MTITGATPLGAYTLQPKPKKIAPAPILADWTDVRTGDVVRLNVSRTVVDGAIIEGFRVERGSGPAVANVGHSIRKVRHTDESSLAELPTHARDAVRDLETDGLVLVEQIEFEFSDERRDGVNLLVVVTDETTRPPVERSFVFPQGQ